MNREAYIGSLIRNMKRLALLALLLLILPCCRGYYRIEHPPSEKVYYTRKIQGKKSGAVEFTDATTGDAVTLSDSAIREISKEEFKQAVPGK